MHWVAPSEKDTATDTLEKRLWAGAGQFRANSGLSTVLKELLEKVSEIPASLDYDAFGRILETLRLANVQCASREKNRANSRSVCGKKWLCASTSGGKSESHSSP